MKRKEYYILVRKNGSVQIKRIKLYDSQIEKVGKYRYPYYRGRYLYDSLEYAKKDALCYYEDEN